MKQHAETMENQSTSLPGALVIEGHVQGLSNTRSLGELGIPVYVTDVNTCLAQFSRYCRKFFKCPAYTSGEFVDFLIKLAQDEGLKNWFIIASNDHIVEQLSKNKERLSLYYRILVPNLDILEIIMDKQRLVQEAQKCRTHFPLTYSVSDYQTIPASSFPLLLKGRKGLSFYKATHKKAIKVNNKRKLTIVLQRLLSITDESNIMLQEFIRNEEESPIVSFTCFAIDGEVLTFWMGEKIREHPIEFGTATYARSVFHDSILAEAIPLIKQLSYSGICEIEFIKDCRDDFYKLIEINPRTWLWVGLAKACGIDYAKIAYRYVNGIEQQYPQTYSTNLSWVNRLTDFVFSMQGIISGRLSIWNYLKSFTHKKVYAIWSWNDVLPGIIFPFMSLYIAKKR